MSKKRFVPLLVLLLLPGLLLAGVTGKIVGRVIDKQSKEALIGANIAVEGTSYGTSADANGDYSILNVPAGVYTVKASFVGYTVQSITGVRVNSDLTTALDFMLSSEAVTLTGVDIVAQKPLVNKSATNAVRVVSGEDISNIPVRGVGAVVALQAGVVEQGGQLFIRGSRQDEVGYYIDGADARDARNGRSMVNIVPEALEEFQLQAGGYNAEYGGANAGIVRQQLKTGSSDFHASFRAETDNFASGGEKFLGGYSYGYSDYAVTLGGPILSDKIKFFLAGQKSFQADPTVAWWDPVVFDNLVEDAAGSNPDPNTGVPDTFSINIPAGKVPGRKLEAWAGNGTLTFDYNPIIVRLSASMNLRQSLFNTTPIRNTLNEARIPKQDESSGLFSAKLTHFLEPTTFYDITLSYQDNRFKRYDPYFEDDYLSYGDSVANYAKGIQYFGRFRAPQDVRVNGFPFTRPGGLNLAGGATVAYQKRKQSYMSGAFDITHQVKAHELKGGFSYQTYSIRNYSIGRLEALYGTLLSNPDVARAGGADLDALYRIGGLPNNYGYDVYGNEIDDGFEGPKEPTYISAYLQDKFEFKDLVVNFGLRFDSFDNDDFEFIDPQNPSYDPVNFTILESGTRKVEAFQTVSPRLGFSFPVTDRTVFHVQYGKFVQAPQLNSMYVSNSQIALSFSGRNFIPVPFGNGLEPERTTQYEIGFTQQFTDFASFDITAFYKDIKGQIQIDRVTTTTGSNTASYNILQNGDYATTKGFEFSLRVRRIERIQATVNYTLSDAQGTGSSLTTAVSAVEAGPIRPTVISPLSFNQAHRGVVNIDYRFGKDDGGPILQRLGTNVLFTFNSGHAFTKAQANSAGGQRGPEEGGILADDDPRTRRPEGSVNSSTTPWNFQVDMKLDKTVSLGDLFDINFFVYVQNLFNIQNVMNVYSRSGDAYDDGFLTNPSLSANIVAANGPRYVELYRAINLDNRQHYWQNQLNSTNPLEGGDLFNSPRQVRFGFNVNF